MKINKEKLIKFISMAIIIAIAFCFFQNKNILAASLFIILGILNIFIKNPFSFFFILLGFMLMAFLFNYRTLFIIFLSCVIIISVFDSIQLIKLMINKKQILINNKEAVSCLRKRGLMNRIYMFFHN